MEYEEILKTNTNPADIDSVYLSKDTKEISQAAFKDFEMLNEVCFEKGSRLEKIGNEAFMHCINIEQIYLPKSVKYIGDYAFAMCSGISIMELSEGIEYIGKGAFYGCNNLVRIKFPKSLKKISKAAFANCRNLVYVCFEGDIEIIDDECFAWCDRLHDVSFYGSVKIIGDEAFRDCKSLEELLIPPDVETIGYRAFLNCESMKNVVLPLKLYCVSAECFSGCFRLESVRFPNNLNCICYSAFYGCKSLKRIRLPPSLKEISHNVFEGCDSLRTVYMPENLDNLDFEAFMNIYPNFYTPDGIKFRPKNLYEEYPEERPSNIKKGKFGPVHECIQINKIESDLDLMSESYYYLSKTFNYGLKNIGMYPDELPLIKSSCESFINSARAVVDSDVLLCDVDARSVKDSLDSIESVLSDFYRRYDEDRSAEIWRFVSSLFKIIEYVYNMLSDISYSAIDRGGELKVVINGRRRFYCRRFKYKV